MKKGYFSTRDMMYGRPGGDARHLERGEMIELAMTPNDQVMINGNYIVDIAASHMNVEPHKCVRCGKEFVDESYKFGHDRGDNPCGREARGEDAAVEVKSGSPISVAAMPGEPSA